MTQQFGKLQTWRVIYTDVVGTCFSSVTLSGTGTLRNGTYNISINGSDANGYRMSVCGGPGDAKELMVTEAATYTDSLISGVTIILAAALVNGDQAQIEVTNQAEMAAGLFIATVTSTSGASVATGWARIHSVKLVPKGCVPDTTLTVYDNTAGSGTKILDAVPILDEMGIRDIVEAVGLECQTGIYAVVSHADATVYIAFSQ